MTNMQEIEQMTIVEYHLRMQAFSLRKIDQALIIHQQAWASHVVNSVEEDGTYTYPNFKSFFDYKELENKFLNQTKAKPESEMDQDLVRIAKRLRKFHERRLKNE
ncbi:hypothetical protein [Lapidilactobacillus bayanensis]|uniref:hypothetical protein n=1 Tax=Lapidilactobacillus bayanensis TaxID=2485998 RepID=UPI000F78469A|nr:hypothetical protein [Lapidilactobacillus bayanensis]